MDSNKRRVVGTPDRKNHYDKPVKVTHSRLYFGEWTGEDGQMQPEPQRSRAAFSPTSLPSAKPRPSVQQPRQEQSKRSRGRSRYRT